VVVAEQIETQIKTSNVIKYKNCFMRVKKIIKNWGEDVFLDCFILIKECMDI
jgi:hypothetical protein